MVTFLKCSHIEEVLIQTFTFSRKIFFVNVSFSFVGNEAGQPIYKTTGHSEIEEPLRMQWIHMLSLELVHTYLTLTSSMHIGVSFYTPKKEERKKRTKGTNKLAKPVANKHWSARRVEFFSWLTIEDQSSEWSCNYSNLFLKGPSTWKEGGWEEEAKFCLPFDVYLEGSEDLILSQISLLPNLDGRGEG